MSETTYTISEAARRLKVESHVLRYWEEELDLDIPRNDMGHRFYRTSDMKRFEDIQYLKERGFQLKSLKTVLPNADLIRKMDKNSVETLKNEVNQKIAEEELAKQVAAAKTEDGEGKSDRNVSLLPKNREEANNFQKTDDPEYRMRQFRLMMNGLIQEALEASQENFTREVSDQISERMIKELDYQMRMQEEREEERFKKLQESLASRSKFKKEAAAAGEKKEKTKKKGLFHRG